MLVCLREDKLLICVIVICACDALIVNKSIKIPNCLLIYYMYMYWLSASIFLYLPLAHCHLANFLVPSAY